MPAYAHCCLHCCLQLPRSHPQHKSPTLHPVTRSRDVGGAGKVKRASRPVVPAAAATSGHKVSAPPQRGPLAEIACEPRRLRLTFLAACFSHVCVCVCVGVLSAFHRRAARRAEVLL